MLNDITDTIRDIANGLPDGGLGYLFALFFELFDKLTDIALAGVLHEDIQDILFAVELGIPHFDYVLMVQRFKNADLIKCPSFLILSHSKATHLHKNRLTFFNAISSPVARSATRCTVAKLPVPNRLM